MEGPTTDSRETTENNREDETSNAGSSHTPLSPSPIRSQPPAPVSEAAPTNPAAPLVQQSHLNSAPIPTGAPYCPVSFPIYDAQTGYFVGQTMNPVPMYPVLQIGNVVPGRVRAYNAIHPANYIVFPDASPEHQRQMQQVMYPGQGASVPAGPIYNQATTRIDPSRSANVTDFEVNGQALHSVPARIDETAGREFHILGSTNDGFEIVLVCPIKLKNSEPGEAGMEAQINTSPSENDTIRYYERVKQAFSTSPHVYAYFMQTVHQMVGGKTSILIGLRHVCSLLRGFNNLILGFNMFLTSGHQIEIRKTKVNLLQSAIANVPQHSLSNATLELPQGRRTISATERVSQAPSDKSDPSHGRTVTDAVDTEAQASVPEEEISPLHLQKQTTAIRDTSTGRFDGLFSSTPLSRHTSSEVITPSSPKSNPETSSDANEGNTDRSKTREVDPVREERSDTTETED